ncbi:nitrogen regulatory protein OTam [Beauveria brongniartii RCEF 3172]|uniref:Nitrogen regulatory protein OTam n=1 Tax=Beauveria brongniartii RCEF 3172 TaxID=1081107 RepID=A0A166XF21_9HYPO|nr:nitrogen regulatory protein OTam [Beauveria brongniartii RCEF 3172]
MHSPPADVPEPGEPSPADAASASIARRRKFTIQSSFGQARERRSRKNRPCDACRRRKTACVITDQPPCRFCETRGIPCLSSGTLADKDTGATADGDHASPDAASPHSVSISSPADSIRHTRPDLFPNGASRPPVTSWPTPSHDSPGSSHHAFSPINVASQQSAARTPVQDSPHPSSQATLPPAFSDKDRPSAVKLPSAATITTFTKGSAEGMGIWPTNGPGRIHTLEDNVNKTANYMGPAAEQDTHVLDSFRYMIVSEIDEIDADYLQVYPGSSQSNDPPVHFLLLENEVPEYTNRPKREASSAIESRVYPYGPNLVRLYFKYVHPVYPVVSKVRFLRLYNSSKEKIPASLRGAVYALATVFWNRDPSLKGPCPWEQHELHTQAQSSLRCELENPNLANLQACLLLIHMAPPWTDTVETPSIWILAAQAVSNAQMSGLHQDPSNWNIESWEKKLRKKLWWAIYMADCWTSICHGNPPHIYRESFDTTPPDLEDVRFDEDVPEDLKHMVDPDSSVFQVAVGQRFLEMVRITRIVREIIDCSFLVNPSARYPHGPDHVFHTLAAQKEKLHEWPALLPQCLSTRRINSAPAIHNNCPLHLMYHAAKVLLFRAILSPATKAARADPNSSLRRNFQEAVYEMQQFATFMDEVTEGDLQGFWGRLGRSQLILCGNFMIHLFIVASGPDDIRVAHHVLLSFHQSLQRLAATQYYVGKLLLRPVALRVDSFFSQAGEIIRRGGHGYWQLDSLKIIKNGTL